jgi:iron complex transport system substrate-binding protein
VALYVVASRFRTYVAGFLRKRMPVLRFRIMRLRNAAAALHRSALRTLAFAALTIPAASCTNGTAHDSAIDSAIDSARQPASGSRSISSPVVRDDFGRAISFTAHPHRVVSLNPTTTETIFAIGAGALLAGRSHWDEWPEAARQVPDMGNGIGPNVEKIVAAHPDLVLLYASEDNRPAAERLESAGIRTISLRIDRIADFDRSVRLLGRVLGDSAAAALVADTVRASLRRVAAATRDLHKPSVVWPLIDTSPMVVGGGSFMNELLTIAGARNVYAYLPQPSPVVSIEDVISKNPDFVVRGGEGGSEAPLAGVWRAVPAIAQQHVIRIPLTMILRPSVQMGTAATVLARALHPGIVLP